MLPVEVTDIVNKVHSPRAIALVELLMQIDEQSDQWWEEIDREYLTCLVEIALGIQEMDATPWRSRPGAWK